MYYYITDKSAEQLIRLILIVNLITALETAIESKLIKDTFNTLKPKLFDTTNYVIT